MATISEALAVALEHHQAGRLQAAEGIYRQILAVEPQHADSLHLLGVVAHQTGKHEAAIEYIGRAIALKGTDAAFHNNLGEAYRAVGRIPEAIDSYRRALELNPRFAVAHNNLGTARCNQGRLEEAVACFHQALELKPGYAEAHGNLGNTYKEQGKLDDAVACYRRVLELKPNLPEAHNRLGNALQDQGNLDQAAVCYRRALELKPDYPEAHNNLGTAFQGLGKLDEALACYRRATDLKPDFVVAHYNLGKVFQEQGRLDEAVACYRRALVLAPTYAEALANLGTALQDQGQLDEAVRCYRRALELKPDLAGAHNNLGNACKDQGSLDEALACYRRALELDPQLVQAHGNLVYTLNFCPDYDARAIAEEHRCWSQRHAEPLAKFILAHANDRSPDRRLRLGYVSPDFRMHPVGRFVLPLLESHDRARFEIFGYSSVAVPDAITADCRAHVDAWRNVGRLSDEQLAAAIREDRIDILVDLTMHMAKGRLLVFARKPAPVQVTYLAYCGTTGLSTMDYRLTDPYLDPPDRAERFYSEESIWLPETYWCYRPIAATPPVNGLPALRAGYVTFGCMNNFGKITAPTLAAWSRLLQTMPKSRLLLHAPAGQHRDRVRDFFAHHRVSAERVTFLDLLPRSDYFRIHEWIDVALDPFPYGGGTTTCDALWMGVPVVTLAGQTAVGRGGLSILSNLGLTDLVAHDCEQYVRIAVELASDLPRLGELRATLRDRLRQSPLLDAPRFARNFEVACRAMWQRWCQGK